MQIVFSTNRLNEAWAWLRVRRCFPMRFTKGMLEVYALMRCRWRADEMYLFVRKLPVYGQLIRHHRNCMKTSIFFTTLYRTFDMLLQMPEDILHRILQCIGKRDFHHLCIIRTTCAQFYSMVPQPNYTDTIIWCMFATWLDRLCHLHFVSTNNDTFFVPVDIVRYYHQGDAYDLAIEVVYHFHMMPLFAQVAAYRRYSCVLHSVLDHIRQCRDTYIDFQCTLHLCKDVSAQ